MAMIWTIGHSNLSQQDFVKLLKHEQIALLADVRRFPGSRAHPHFHGSAMATWLEEEGIDYRHFEALGGRRRRVGDSPNTAWRVAAFNAYADHALTDEFQNALQELESEARQQRVAMMCAEALPWRCHRRIIADHLLARGWQVLHIMSRQQIKSHTLPDFARVEAQAVTYPGGTLFDVS